MRATIKLFSLLVVPILVLGCEAVVGIPSDVERATDGTDAPLTCAPSTESNACFKCTDESCCTQYDACQADPRCSDYYKSCLPDCKSGGKTFDECVVECDSKNGAGHALFAAYNACGADKCLGPCADGKPDACVTCTFANCRDLTYACTADRECDTLTACVGSCEGKPDRDACADACNTGKGPAARDLFNRKFTCFLTFCQKPCLP